MAKAYEGTATVNTNGDILSPQKETNGEIVGYVKRFWAVFHNLIIAALLFTLLGVGVGVRVAKDYYAQKLDEVVQTGAMLHKQKVYTIQPKI